MPTNDINTVSISRSDKSVGTHLLEVGASGEDLVDKVLYGEDVVLSEIRLDNTVVGKRDPLLVDLSISPLVDQLPHRLEVGLAVSDIRLNETEHLLSCFCDFDEDTVVDLKQTEELEDFTGFGCDFVDT